MSSNRRHLATWEALRTEIVNINKDECNTLSKEGFFTYNFIRIYINKDVNINFIKTETYD